jgi:hypothetical protein
MLKGIHLTLLIGPAVPVPAPKAVLDALTGVEVNSATGKSGFQLTFSVGKNSPLATSMLPAGYFDPMVTRVIIVVTVRGIPNVLMDGMVTRQEVSPSNEPGQSTLTITGEDLSVLMDVIEVSFMRYPQMPVVAQMNAILAKYAVLGIVPLVVPPIFEYVPPSTDEIPTQTGTDLAYIQEQAENNGYIFHIEPGPAPGANVAYWGPDIWNPVLQPALNVNMDSHTNVESLSFSLDGLAKKILVLYVFDPASKKLVIPVPVPNVSLLRPPLGARVTAPSKMEFAKDLVKFSPLEAAARALAQTAASSDAVSGSGSLDVLRYGRVLKARQVVGVRGAGIAYDGLYYVNSVTHNIKRGEYKQNFNLSRDGLVSPTPMVAP